MKRSPQFYQALVLALPLVAGSCSREPAAKYTLPQDTKASDIRCRYYNGGSGLEVLAFQNFERAGEYLPILSFIKHRGDEIKIDGGWRSDADKRRIYKKAMRVFGAPSVKIANDKISQIEKHQEAVCKSRGFTPQDLKPH